MKKKEIAKLKVMKKEDLLKGVAEAREQLRDMKFDLSAGKVKNENAVRELKKKIARMLTFIKQQKEGNSPSKLFSETPLKDSGNK